MIKNKNERGNQETPMSLKNLKLVLFHKKWISSK